MPSQTGRRSSCQVKLVLVMSVATVTLLTGAFIAVNIAPSLAAQILGLDPVGPLSGMLHPETPPIAEGTPLEVVDLFSPSLIAQTLSVTPEDVLPDGFATHPLIGDATRPGKTTYHVTLSEEGLNQLLREHQLAGGRGGESAGGTRVDLYPGALVLRRDLDLGLTKHRVGLLLLQEGTTLSLEPGGVLLNDGLYGMPESRSLAGILLPRGRRVQRALDALVVTGPLPGKAGAKSLYLHEGRLTIAAEAVYALSSLDDTGWRILEAGLHRREIEVPANAERGSERLHIVRLVPSAFDIRIHYDPANPRTVSDWAAESGALLTVNGSYFSQENDRGFETIGLLVSDGQRWGSPLQDFAGMLAVREDGQVSVRWLRHRPYDAAEPLTQALQSFPVLVKPGGIMGFPADADDGTPARRTVVGQDSEGNLLFVLAPRGTMSLHELAVLLSEQGLGLDVALNLDGGRSSGMWLKGTEWDVSIDSIASVPSAVVILRR